MKRSVFFTVLVSAVLLLPLTASATIINIPEDYPTIQEGIDHGADGDTVLVQPDTYYENLNFNGHNVVLASLFLMTGDTAYVSSTIIDGNQETSVIIFESGEDSTAQVVGFTIQNGYAENGGGIYSVNSDPTITNNRISGNSAVNYGGGIYCLESDVSITDNTISENLAGPRGGGIHCEGISNITIANNTISGNTAMQLPSLGHGAGISCKDGPVVTISENDISGNYAYVAAGGIWSNCNSTIVKNTITGNIAEKNNGGGIACFYAFEVINNTITRNSVADLGSGGGIFSSRATPIVTNTIVYENYAPPGYQDELAGAFVVTYSDIKGGWSGTGNIDEDPLFVDPGNGDFHLQWGSPCIDAGDPASPLDPDGTRADIGALYFHQAILSIEIIADDPPPVTVPQGGSFGFTGTLINNTEDPQITDAWTVAIGPQKEVYGPFKEFYDFYLDPGETRSAHFNQRVPNLAPLGFYNYIAYCGDYPSTVMDSSFFELEVIAGPSTGTGEGGWVLTGSFLEGVTGLPSKFALLSNYPNPFNASTMISYQLPVSGHVKLEVYNLFGQKVATLIDSEQEAGYKSITWDASEVSSGLYFYKLTAGDYTEIKTMTLLR